MEYRVDYIRAQGVECKWSRNRSGAPIIIGKTDKRDLRGNLIWASIDRDMWNRAAAVGIKQAFEEYTALIGLLSVRA